MILDEPTANLDTLSSDVFYGLLEKVKIDTIVIVISHDYKDVEYFDNIINI